MTMKTYIAGNWKMNQIQGDIRNFFQQLEEQNLTPVSNAEAWIAPQFIHIDLLKQVIASSANGKFAKNIMVGAQNCSHQEKGAFTGDVSPKGLADMGCHFIIIGHSERRTVFKEDNQILKTKLQLALNQGLKVIFCIGETLAERERGAAFEVVRTQLIEGLSLDKGDQAKFNSQLLLAYEPVWAIGTGKTATPEQAQEMHAFIRKELGERLGLPSEEIPLLYGGSVTPQNVEELLRQKDINGALVGGASLKAPDFAKLYLAAKVKIG